MIETSERDKLSQMLAQRLELFEQMAALGEKQTKLLEEEKFSELDVSLDEAKELREKINGLHQDSEPLMQSYLSCPPEHKDDGIEAVMEKMREQLELCQRINEKNMLAMESKTIEQSKKIDEQSAKRKGISGYAQTIPDSSEVFDKKS